VPSRTKATALVRRIGRSFGAAKMESEPAQPVLIEVLIDDAKKRPHQALRKPRIALRLDSRGRSNSIADQRPGRWKLDVRANAIGTPGARTQASREPLRDPAFHPTGMDRNYLRGEWIGQSVDQKLAESLDQPVGAFGSMDVEHAVIRLAVAGTVAKHQHGPRAARARRPQLSNAARVILSPGRNYLAPGALLER
jgi:hypothetical protein